MAFTTVAELLLLNVPFDGFSEHISNSLDIDTELLGNMQLKYVNAVNGSGVQTPNVLTNWVQGPRTCVNGTLHA